MSEVGPAAGCLYAGTPMSSSFYCTWGPASRPFSQALGEAALPHVWSIARRSHQQRRSAPCCLRLKSCAAAWNARVQKTATRLPNHSNPPL